MAKFMKQFKEAAKFLKKQYKHVPQVGLVLGTGLGSFINEMEIELEVDYNDIPHFPITTVPGHKGKLIFGNISGKKVVAMVGRLHFYEGYDAAKIIFPIRVMKLLGVEVLMLSNAAGGVNPDFKIGDLMIIRDHISLFAPNPLVGKNIDELGPRFPDMAEPYKGHLIAKAKDVAARQKIEVKEGVYYAVTGPSFETKAEYKMIHILGGDAVGMSTVQETIVAYHMGMSVFAMSVITDLGSAEIVVGHESVLEAAKAAEPKFAAIFKGVIEAI